jgi:hypothetical protein
VATVRLALGLQLQYRAAGAPAEPAEADRLFVVVQPGGALAGEALQTQPVVRILDQYGQVWAESGVAVTVAKLSGPGVLSGTTEVETDEQGIAEFTDLVLSAEGEVVLRFTATGLTQVDSAAFDVEPADVVDANQSTLVAAPALIAADGIEEAEILATARNAAGTPLEGLDVVLAAEVVEVDAAESTAASDHDEIPDDGSVAANILITVLDSEGRPIAGMPVDGVVTIAVSGSNNTITQPTGVTNALGQTTGFFTSTTAEVKTVTPTANGVVITQQPTVTVTGAPAEGTVLFSSDWGTGTGNGETALRDGVWNGPLNAPDDPADLAVVEASAVELLNAAPGTSLADAGCPTANALQGIYDGESAGTLQTDDDPYPWDEMEIGESRVLQWDFCHDGDDALGGNENNNSIHNPQAGPVGLCPGLWSLNYDNRSIGGAAQDKYRLTLTHTHQTIGAMRFRLGDPQNPGSADDLDRLLDKGKFYRVALKLTKSGATTITPSIRLYDRLSGELLFDQDDFHRHASPYAALSASTFSYDNYQTSSCSQGVIMGWNAGSQPGGMPAGVRFFWAKFRVATDWLLS